MDAATVGLIGAGLGYLGGSQSNEAALDRQNSANAFSAHQFATRYQTTVADLKAAGLNPMLAYTQGGGSPPSSAQPAPVTNSLRDAADVGTRAYTAARSAELHGAQTENTQADTIRIRADRFLKEAQTMQAGASAAQSQAIISNLENVSAKIQAEIKNIPIEGERLHKMVSMLNQQAALMQKQGFNVEQMTKQLEWLTIKTARESDLLTLDVQAAKDLGNLGREFSQIKPILDFFRSFIGRR